MVWWPFVPTTGQKHDPGDEIYSEGLDENRPITEV
jgi:hypothetical protein